jgi:iron complex transport system ATP-binding protein
VEGVSLRLEAGDFLALVGPNGAGKTTLMRAVLGLVATSGGRVLVGSEPTSTLTPRARARELAWLPQQALPAEPVPALEAVMAARYRFDETRMATRHAAEQALGRVGLAGRATSLLSELSGGERQRVAIASLLAQEARFLLLDEPANHLDPAQQGETYGLLGRLRSEGIGILCITHDVNLLNHVRGATRVAGLSDGKLHFTLDFAAPELPDRLSALFGVRMLTLPAGSARVIVPAPPDVAGGDP